MNDERQKLFVLLSENIKQLTQAGKVLESSVKRCSDLQFNIEEATDEELEKFEALTSRFARLADLILQKSIRLIELIELEGTGSILDRINRAEKQGIIGNAEDVIEIRQLRNSIAHEYEIGHLQNLFSSCLEYAPILLADVERLKRYCQKWSQNEL